MKLVRSIILTLILVPSLVWADAASQLRAKLVPMQQFSADFAQTVISPEGKTIHEAQGQLVMAKPGKVFWQEQSPGDDEIISDGHTIWYYSPMVEQVSIYDANDAIAHTPFILLANQSSSLWKDYQVKAVKKGFQVSSKSDSEQPTFVIYFDGKKIRQFDVVDAQGQRSEFVLSHFVTTLKKHPEGFKFTVPEGIDIDDQRQSHE